MAGLIENTEVSGFHFIMSFHSIKPIWADKNSVVSSGFNRNVMPHLEVTVLLQWSLIV